MLSLSLLDMRRVGRRRRKKAVAEMLLGHFYRDRLSARATLGATVGVMEGGKEKKMR